METKNIVITGANGFVGRNLSAVISRREDVRLFVIDVGSDPGELDAALQQVDVVFHLAGVNRPERVEDFETGNVGSLVEICDKLRSFGRRPKIVLSSSIQAESDNPYGRSKRRAEEVLRRFCEEMGADGVAFRLSNLFGKWSRPNYNSVTATFCHNIARGLPIAISDPANEVTLTYIDDVVAAFTAEIDAGSLGFRFAEPLPSRRITLGELASHIEGFRAERKSLHLADFGDPFVRALYATYLSYLEPESFAYDLEVRTDNRGSLAEFVKSAHAGQIFVSRTKPGITRGNHYHHTKVEKFFVVEGEAAIRLRHIGGGEVIEIKVCGEDYRIVDIPPGYTHSIENTGAGELVTLFWSAEIFDSERPDTTFLPVKGDQ